MPKKTAKEEVNSLKENAKSIRESFETIKKSAENAPEDIRKHLAEMEKHLNPIQEAANKLIPKDEKWGWVQGFIRRMTSREVLIAVATIITIAASGLGPQESIGVAIAGAGLILGRSAVKVTQKDNRN